MSNEREFFRCNVCGNLTERIIGGQGEMVCCGQPMEKLAANTVDAAQEKHVPALKREGNTLHVNVGSVDHPMLEEHHIAFIVVAQGDKTYRAALEVGGKPHAEFMIGDGPVKVYEWCNLHGLWSAEG